LSSPAEKIDIVVGAFPADAALFRMNGVRTLFMGQGQTFTRAVENVMNVLPGITREAAERMIREQCPEFRDLDDMLGLNTQLPPSVERPPVDPQDDVAKEQLPGTAKRRRRAFLVAALLPALAASWALGRYTNVVDSEPVHAKASAPDAAPDTAVETAPFAGENFDYFSGASKIECNPVSTLEAECTDSDGMVMSTKAATGPDSTIFTFAYGREQIGLRIFYDADYAKTWSRQDGSREMYRHMQVHDRYVLWGTDTARIAEYMKLLKQADKDAGPSAMGGATPLPPRLAALTLGTLGLDRQEVHQIIARPADSAVDGPSMVAARLVLGLDTTPVYGTSDSDDDIVALAIGIQQPPATGGAVLVSTPTAPSTPAAPPSKPSTPATPSTPETPAAPATPTAPSAPSTPETPPADPVTAPPAETTPPSETTPPAETPPAETTPPPAPDPEPSQPDGTVTPPVEETPPPAAETPVEETPTPTETPAEGATPPGQGDDSEPADSPDQGHQAPDDEGQDNGGDLLILASAWTVATAA
jgi:hypothetical protein